MKQIHDYHDSIHQTAINNAIILYYFYCHYLKCFKLRSGDVLKLYISEKFLV